MTKGELQAENLRLRAALKELMDAISQTTGDSVADSARINWALDGARKALRGE
jgi:hypothetical protein